MRRAKLNDQGLGKALLRQRFKGQRRDGDFAPDLHTTELDDGANWTRLQSITQQRDIDEFLHTAALQDKDFTAEKQNIKIITADSNNPFILTVEQEIETKKSHSLNKHRLKIPRRPKWTTETSPNELHKMERESFLQWRRDMAMQRSDVVVQIVDARNPLLFRSEDLESYIKEISPKKKCILLINKADMLNDSQREHWAQYFESNGIQYFFFSAKLATLNQQNENESLVKREVIALEKTRRIVESINKLAIDPDHSSSDNDHPDQLQNTQNDAEINKKLDLLKEQEFNQKISNVNIDQEEKRTRVVSPEELVGLLVKELEPLLNDANNKRSRVIGLVGYPNVGKSSTINALVGAKRVSVGSMPGKTKHFQTIPLTSDITLCDCPGLVFPTFATTAADMVINGVLPIDQLREYTGPSALVAQRVPKWVIEAIYGISIYTKPTEDGGTGIPTAEELLVSYAAARGLSRSSQGNPDESRAARRILKDYVDGKLLYTHPPPNVDEKKFNKDLFDPKKFTKKAQLHEDEEGNITGNFASTDKKKVALASSGFQKKEVKEIDEEFFVDKKNLEAKFKKTGPIGIGSRVDDNGNTIPYMSGTDAAVLEAKKILEDKKQGRGGKQGKKHKKGKKNVKMHSGSIYD
ncbi:hypothetical protein BB560_005887 [Smittium megazygosporum]|uniref:CP-type G domain-containing protein n=1 Tax=Smittium megazygosporum TaxID=133381 RepID=A0A2T9YRX7_9FUNG|nr:hypothetical protein BB560_005887 [Smittium megazygosporum]